MTRLLQAMAGAEHGGAEAFFTRLVIALEQTGQEQSIAIRRQPDRAAQLRQASLTVTELAFGGLFDLRTRLALKRLLVAFKPDVVLTWMSRATALMPAGPYIHVGRLGGYYDLKYYRRCDHLIGNTPDIVKHLINAGWPCERAHYLPNFVGTQKAAPLPRAQFSTPQEAPLVLALGRLHANKAFDILVSSMTSLPETYLWLAGEGSERRALEAQIAALGLSERVKLLGWRDDISSLMASADLLVCPSRHEPLGNVILEAWARHLPVVAAASQGPRQLIESGVNGVLVPIDDAEALGSAVRELLAAPDLCATLAAAGYASYEASYSEAAVVGAYRDFFERVAA